MNSNLLKAKIIENGFTLSEFSKITGIKKTALYRKLSGKTEFKRQEIEKIAIILKLSAQQIKDIFLTKKCRKRNATNRKEGEIMPRKIMKPIQNIDYALKVYYGVGYINNKDIKAIFDIKSDSSVWKLKKMVRDEEIKRAVPVVIPSYVNAKIAFEVWGLDVKEIERNRQKLIALNL